MTPKCAWSGSRDPFLNFGAPIICSEWVKESTSDSVRRLILASTRTSVHDRLSPEGVCLGSRNMFRFWEVTDNISEMVQDRDISYSERLQ